MLRNHMSIENTCVHRLIPFYLHEQAVISRLRESVRKSDFGSNGTVHGGHILWVRIDEAHR